MQKVVQPLRSEGQGDPALHLSRSIERLGRQVQSQQKPFNPVPIPPQRGGTKCSVITKPGILLMSLLVTLNLNKWSQKVLDTLLQLETEQRNGPEEQTSEGCFVQGCPLSFWLMYYLHLLCGACPMGREPHYTPPPDRVGEVLAACAFLLQRKHEIISRTQQGKQAAYVNSCDTNFA